MHTTVILVRHAEKDTVGGNDPVLSAVGNKRAARLQETLKEYKPDAFYSTNFKRTKETLLPWAKAAGKEIQVYDPATQTSLADLFKTQQGKTLVVVGHSNTIPQLVNLITGTNQYQQLPDTEYSKIFIVTIPNVGSPDVKVLTF
ncbi:hypothetical protein SAE01_00200 [Segetibacter aerophilus]|uniref:Phosphoglycerate mutase n=1 Tax=Segetibacter aerophilus TaxID=670293 RepID=A0A512B6C4_9BACT|nr:hypothetical protein SAE01_00200 [Segetibacter aerophilus]